MRVLISVVVLGTVIQASGANKPDSIQLSPTTIAIAAGESAASVLVKNDGTRPASLAVSAFAWRTSPTNDMQLERTDDLIVYPVRVDVAPGETRRLRIGSRVKAERVERAYRIILDQVGESAAPGAIALKMRYNLPVFIQPKARTATVKLGDIGINAGQLFASLENAGAVHVTPRSVRAVGKLATGQTAWTRDLQAWYLLPGLSRSFREPLTSTECQRTAAIEIEATFLEGAGLTVRRSQPIGRGVCGQP